MSIFSTTQPKSAPGVTRTPGLRIRNPLLYPAELRAQIGGEYYRLSLRMKAAPCCLNRNGENLDLDFVGHRNRSCRRGREVASAQTSAKHSRRERALGHLPLQVSRHLGL